MARGKSNAPVAETSSGGKIWALVFLGVALVAALSGGVVIYQLVKSYESRIADMKKPEPTVKAVLAARELFKGHPITEDDIVVVDVPPQFLPGGDDKLVFASPQHVVGRVPREHILPNEYIREQRLADPETGAGLNAIIPRTWRAISVNIQDGAALSGLLRPGSYVDVVVTITPDDEKEKISQTYTLLQAVYVLAVNDQTEKVAAVAPDADPRKAKTKEKKANTKKLKPSVTLAVRPQQAEAIAHASELGEITLTARRIDEVEFVENLSGTTGDAIAGYEKPKPVEVVKAAPKVVAVKAPEPPKEEGPTLQITKGTKTTTVQVNKTP